MEKNKSNLFFLLGMIFLLPISYFAFGKYMNFDTLSAIFFVLILVFLIIKNRKKLEFQSMLKLGNIPLIYAVLWKTKFGLKLMDKISNKYREFVKLIGYCFIGFGFLGLIYVSFSILTLLFQLFISPRTASEGVGFVLPLTNVPGLGYLSFWHFLIAVFITAAIHEFAHGILARAHNVPIESSGLGVFSLIAPLFPVAFVEPKEKKLNKEKDIVQYSIFAAGPMINICLAFILILLVPYVANPFVLAPFEDKITHPTGISFTSLMVNYSAQEVGMKPGMVINSVNGQTVLDYKNFSATVGRLNPGQTIVIGTTNGTSYTIVAKPSPSDKSLGYIGILGPTNERQLNLGQEVLGKIFYWIKELIKWIFRLNFLIGLMNLLPLMITDGGRMLKIAFERIFSDKKKADKVWVFIGAIFIFTILFALSLRYAVFPLLKLAGIG